MPRHARTRRLPCAALLCACVTVAACGGEHVDLVSRFDEATVSVETRRIDIGTETGRRHLTGGWLDHDELWLGREEQTFVWSGRYGAEIAFHVFEQRDLTSEARGWPRLVEGEPAVTSVTLVLNGVPVTELDVEPGARDYRFTLPAQLLRVGRNRLLLQYQPGPRGWVGDGRRQFAWDWMEFGRTVITDLARRELPEGTRALLVPYLSEVAYELRPPVGASLRLRVRHFGPRWDEIDPGRLVVRLADGDGEVLRETELQLDRSHRVDLALPEDTDPLHIAFITLPPGSGRTRAEKPMNEQIGGAMLIRPRLE